MKTETIKKLCQELEGQFGIRIIYVAEAGSRAWGYSTPESDYDVRLIYVQLPWLKQLDNGLDTIHEKFHVVNDGKAIDIDILGYEARKAFGMFTRSDATLFEIMCSHVVYYRDSYCVYMRETAQHYLNPSALFHAFLDQAARNLYPKRGTPYCPKGMLHALRFTSMAITLFALDKELPHIETNIRSLLGNAVWKETQTPMVDSVDWLNSMRDANMSDISSDPVIKSIYLLYEEARNLTPPAGERNRDLEFAQSRFCDVVEHTIMAHLHHRSENNWIQR